MSQTIILTEDQYAILAQASKARNQTPEGILAEWIEAMREGNRVLKTSSYRMRHVEGDPNSTQPSMHLSQGSSKRR